MTQHETSQKTDEQIKHELIERATPIEGPAIIDDSLYVVSEQPSKPTSTINHEIMTMAIELDEDPSQIKVQKDMRRALERMTQGLVIDISISRPRFKVKFDLDAFGLNSMSMESKDVVNNYFQLGRRSLLPVEYRKELDAAEGAARFVLGKYSFPTYWGRFVSRASYADWKRANAEMEEKFWGARDRVLQNYDQIVEQVVREHRPLAEQAWRTVRAGEKLNASDEVTREVVDEILTFLGSVDDKARFIQNYLQYVRDSIPELDEIEDAFSYEVKKFYIPLPSQLAQDAAYADHLYRQQAIEEAGTQAELSKIERDRRAQEEMDADLLREARAQKNRLIQEFYTGIVYQINEMTLSVTDSILKSLEKHRGVLRGPVSEQLKNLVTTLEQMNFVEDETMDAQIARLNAVLPTKEQKIQAGKGLARIDTSNIQRALRVVHDEAVSIKVDLAIAPRERKSRDTAAISLSTVDLGTSRREVREISPEINPPVEKRSRRRQERSF